MKERKVISMDKVYLRESHLNSGIVKRNTDKVYPLYENYNLKNHYNFKNLRESLEEWYNFSNSVTNNINQTCHILKIIDTYGTDSELTEATNLICTSIIPYLENPNSFKYNYNKLREEEDCRLNKSIDTIFKTIHEQVECDRIINNHNLISKRFNVDKLFSNILKEDGIQPTIFIFCNLLETYNLNIKTKYCIANECAAYASSKYVQDIDYKSISENIIDFYLTQYGNTDVPRFLSTIRDCIQKDNFIGNEAIEYTNYLEKVYNNIDGYDYDIEYFTSIDEDANREITEEFDEYGNTKQIRNTLYETALGDKAKEMITKFKLVPTKTVSALKSAILAVFSQITAEDVKEVVKTALKIAFFSLIVLGAFAVTVIAVIIGFICHQIYSRYFSDRAKLKDAIDELRDHCNEVNRKIEEEQDANRKSRMEVYVTELKTQIAKLQMRYEEMVVAADKASSIANNVSQTAQNIGSQALTTLGMYSTIKNITDTLKNANPISNGNSNATEGSE